MANDVANVLFEGFDDEGSSTEEGPEKLPAAPSTSSIEVPAGFVPATKAQVAYWRQLCGALSTRGAAGMRDTDWPPELAPTRMTLRALEERRLVVRRGRAWHLRRGWYTTLTLLRLTAVPTPPLAVAERPAAHLPAFAELEQWEHVCRWLDAQPGRRARLPLGDVPHVGAVSADVLQGMRRYRLIRHAADCTWRLTAAWKGRLFALWQGVTKAEGERQPTTSDTPAPYSVAAGIDTWYLNRLDAEGLPTPLKVALDDLQAQAREDDEEIDTPWEYDGVPLLMYRTGVNTTQGGGVSWAYILRNRSLTALIRKAPLGEIILQARLGSECLWRRTPLAALNELDLLIRRMWHVGQVEQVRRERADRHVGAKGRWQVSQVHLAHDVAHAPLAVEQLERYVTRSRKQAIFEAARADMQALYRNLDGTHPADATDAWGDVESAILDWDDFYVSDGADDEWFDVFAPFALEGGRATSPKESIPVEDRATQAYRWARRLSGITWSPGAAVSFVAYDKLLEGRLRGKSHMEPIWRASGWDGRAPVTRHEARLRRDALRSLGISDAQLAVFDDPWQLLDHQQDLYAYVVGRPTATTVTTDCPQVVDVAWIRRVVPDPGESNRSRWPTDPVWAVVQEARFTEAPATVRRLIRRKVHSQEIRLRDRGAYGLIVNRTALAFADPKHWDLSYAVRAAYRAFEQESECPGKAFHTLVRERRRLLGLPVAQEEYVLPRRSQPLANLPELDRAIDHDDNDDHDKDAGKRVECGEDAEDTSGTDERQSLALLRTVRRLEEIEVALDAEKQAQAHPNSRRIREIESSYEQELKVYEAIYGRMPGNDAG